MGTNKDALRRNKANMATSKKENQLVTRQFTAEEDAIVSSILNGKLAEKRANDAKAVVQVLFKAVTGGEYTLADLKACFDGISNEVLNLKMQAAKMKDLTGVTTSKESPEKDETIREKLSAIAGDVTLEDIAKMLNRGLPIVRVWVKKALHWGILETAGKHGHSLVYRKKALQAATLPS